MKLQYLHFIPHYDAVIGAPVGLSEVEILELEEQFGVVFPNAYKEFLSLFGKDSGHLLKSYWVTVNKLALNKESALDASEDELSGQKVEVKDNWFFFAQWQGYNFFFFECMEGMEDPAVYMLDDSPYIAMYKDSFTQFIKEEGLEHLGHAH